MATIYSEVITWTDADGTDHVMNHANGCVALVGKRGRFMPPVELTADPVVGLPGTRVRGMRWQDREIAIPVGFRGSSHLLLHSAMEDWREWLNPARGPGRLTVERTWTTGMTAAGWTRGIAAYYVGGYEGAETEEDMAGAVLKAVLVFRAVDPFWSDAAASSQGFPVSGIEADFTSGTPGDVPNTGDVDTWPTWYIVTGADTITAPIILNNTTTGKTITYDANVAADTILEISTEPGSRSCRSRPVSGPIVWTNRWGNLDPSSEFWPLIPGSNMVGVDLGGFTSPATFTVDAYFTIRHLGV